MVCANSDIACRTGVQGLLIQSQRLRDKVRVTLSKVRLNEFHLYVDVHIIVIMTCSSGGCRLTSHICASDYCCAHGVGKIRLHAKIHARIRLYGPGICIMRVCC